MSLSAVESTEYKERQRSEWRQAAAGWRRWADRIEEGGRAVSEKLCDLAAIGPGDRVLDVATGYGEPALTAAERVGPDGWVLGTDISPEMLEVARERAEAAGASRVEFRASDGEAIDLPEKRFDAAVSRFGLMLMPDPAGALRRIAAALEPEGRMAATTWGPPERVPLIGLPFAALGQLFELPEPPPGAPGVFAITEQDRLGSLFSEAGFSDVRTGAIEVTYRFDSADQYSELMRDVAPPINAILADRSAEERERAWEAITDLARERADEDGSVALTNEAIWAAGTA